MPSLSRKLAAEFLGTFGLVLVSTAAICADQFLRSSNRAGLSPLEIALAYGLAYGAMFVALGRGSGGQFNPAITIGFWATHKHRTFDMITYVGAQLAGAAAASYTLRSIVSERVWAQVMLGTPKLAGGLTRGPAMLIEAMLTLLLVVVFAAAASLPRSVPGDSAAENSGRRIRAGIALAAVVTAGAMLGAPYTGGIMNPARAFGPALAAHHWANQGVYWVGPLAGAMVAAVLCDFLSLRVPSPASGPSPVRS
jgi:glycerol uptake facilitator-like aquaporin